MYPVPAHNFINVKTTFNGTQAFNVKILDATGKSEMDKVVLSHTNRRNN